MTTIECQAEPRAIGDRELARLAATDAQAFALLYERHAPGVAAYVRRRWGSRDLDEIVAEVFAEAFMVLSSYRGDAPLGAWLCGIATRRLSRRMRRRREIVRRAPAHEARVTPDVDHAVRAIGRLPRGQQDVMWLCLVKELTAAQAASALGVAEGTVKSRLSRARRRLRDELKEDV